jgi:hypothetical protein
MTKREITLKEWIELNVSGKIQNIIEGFKETNTKLLPIEELEKDGNTILKNIDSNKVEVRVGTPIDIWEGVGSSREQDIDKLEVYYVDEKEITDYNSLWEITKSGWDSESEFVYPYIQVNGEWLRWDNQSLRMDMGIYVWTKENQQKYIGVMLTGGFDDERIVMKNPMTSNGIKIGRNQPCHCGSGIKFKKCCLN